MRFSKHLVVATVVPLVSGIAAPGIAAAGTGPSWAMQSPVSPDARQGGILLGASCPSATDCTAVGAYAPRYGYIVMLAERWHEGKWRVQSTRNPPRAKDSSLYAVSCSSARACTAVGQDSKGTLAERWNGRKWAAQPTPDPPGSRRSELHGVSCPSATDCTAAGDYYDRSGTDVTLAERWNGRKWAIQPTPNPAAGTDGTELLGVSCTSAASCTAVGDANLSSSRSDTLAEHWNGTKWAIQATPKPRSRTESELREVSCPSATDCTAAGDYLNRSGTDVTLAEHWNGRKWAIQPTPNPSGSPDGSELTAVSCPSATDCTAAGDYHNKSDTDVTLAEHWNGTTWAIQPTPNPPESELSALKGVSCSSATACTTVGAYLKSHGAEPTLAERYS